MAPLVPLLSPLLLLLLLPLVVLNVPEDERKGSGTTDDVTVPGQKGGQASDAPR